MCVLILPGKTSGFLTSRFPDYQEVWATRSMLVKRSADTMHGKLDMAGGWRRRAEPGM